MKKLTIIALSAALTLALVVACGGGETAAENAPVAPAGSEPATSADGGVVNDSGDIDAGDGEVTGEDIDPAAPTGDVPNDADDTVSIDASPPNTGAENGNGVLDDSDEIDNDPPSDSGPAVGLDSEPPTPTNPPDITPPTVIGGNEVADRESGGSFEGPANSEVTLPPGAVPSDIGFVGVALVELDAPPAAVDLPPELGEFIEGALVLDVTFETQRGETVSILENAATVCLPVNQFILAAVGGAVERLQIVRYHNGSWGSLVSEYRANEGVICAQSQVFSEFALTALPAALVVAPPVNPPDVEPPTVIDGNEVADTESGGDFEGPANSSVTLPPGAVPSDIGFVGVALVELDAPPAPEDLPPELGEFIEGALVLDVTFETQRGWTVSILENAATVCLPVNEFILAAVGGAAERLLIVRYHLGSWGGLVSEYRADEGVICAESQVFSEFALTALPVAQVELPGGDAGVGLVDELPEFPTVIQDYPVSVRIAPGSLRINQPGGSFIAGSQTEFMANYNPVQVTDELVRYGTNWQVISGGQFLNIPNSGGAVEIVRDLATGDEIPQYSVSVLPRAAGTAQLQLTITELDENDRPISGTEIVSNVIIVTVVAPRVAW